MHGEQETAYCVALPCHRTGARLDISKNGADTDKKLFRVCPEADGIAKKHLCLPSDWSFTPDELREFVRCEPYGSIASIDLDTALAIYMEENLSLIAQDFVGEKIQGNTM